MKRKDLAKVVVVAPREAVLPLADGQLVVLGFWEVALCDQAGNLQGSVLSVQFANSAHEGEVPKLGSPDEPGKNQG